MSYSCIACMDRARTIELVDQHVAGVKLGDDKLFHCIGLVSILVGGVPHLAAIHIT